MEKTNEVIRIIGLSIKEVNNKIGDILKMESKSVRNSESTQKMNKEYIWYMQDTMIKINGKATVVKIEIKGFSNNANIIVEEIKKKIKAEFNENMN